MYDPLKKLTGSIMIFRWYGFLQRIRKYFLHRKKKREGRKKRTCREIVFQNVPFNTLIIRTAPLRNKHGNQTGETIAIVGYTEPERAPWLILFSDSGIISPAALPSTERTWRIIPCRISGRIWSRISGHHSFRRYGEKQYPVGKPTATKEEIIEAAKAAYAHEFVMNMPNGYDTSIGEEESNYQADKSREYRLPAPS